MNQSHMTRIGRAFLVLISFSLFLIACKKGDTGSTGPAGPKGDKGDKGDSGVAGTANVFYSTWQYASNFSDTIIDNSNMHTGKILAPKITTDILNQGAVLVYFTYGGGVFPLPHTTYAGNKTSTINYVPMFQKLLLTRFTQDNSNSVNLSTVLQYRYIIIPGGVATNKAGGLKTGQATDEPLPSVDELKAMPYEDVCAKLGIAP